MLLVLTSQRPKVGKDLNYINTKKLKSLWVECKLKKNNLNGGTQLMNASYNPIKSLTGDVIEGLSISIDYAIVKNKLFTLMGDYTINCLNRKERNCLNTSLTPYGLHILNKTEPTRTKGASESLIDYIIMYLPNGSFSETYISDNLLKPKIMTHVDHRAISAISKLGMNMTR